MEFDDSTVSCHIISCTVQGESKKTDTFDIQMNNKGVSFFWLTLYMNLHESMTQFPTGKIATDVYTIDIVIALLNTVCFVNISIPKAKGKHICE